MPWLGLLGEAGRHIALGALEWRAFQNAYNVWRCVSLYVPLHSRNKSNCPWLQGGASASSSTMPVSDGFQMFAQDPIRCTGKLSSEMRGDKKIQMPHSQRRSRNLAFAWNGAAIAARRTF